MNRPHFSIGELLLLILGVAIGLSGIYAAQYVFYYQGRSGLLLALTLFWGGVLILIIFPIRFLVRAFRRR